MKILAIGDIHAKPWIIDKVNSVIDNYDKVIFVGDYADDWWASPLETVGTWQVMFELQNRYPDKVEALIGNHDYAYILSSPRRSSGYNTVTKLILSSPENASLNSWLRSLKISVTIDDVTYSHAGVHDKWLNGSLSDSDSPIWLRPDCIYSGLNYMKNQVFGHTPCSACYEVQPSVWCIDTFSTDRSGENIGDKTVLEITDGKEFNVIKL